MKVLQVNSVYDFGSTGKITADIHRRLQQHGIESVVCYGRRNNTTDSNVYRICNDFYARFEHLRANITGAIYGGCELSTYKLIEIIKKEKPDIVHLQCINGYFVNIYRLVQWLKNNHFPTVLTLHAEFMYTGGCGHSIECDQWSTNEGCGHSICPRYRSELKSILGDPSAVNWHKMKNAFDGFNKGLIVVSVSPWLMDRANRSSILKGKEHCVVFNGVNTDVFKPYDTNGLRQKHHCEGKKVVFHATPFFCSNPNHIKGGYYIIELAKKMPDFCFIVAGQVMEDMDIPFNVILLGKIDSQELLAEYYSMADVTVLVSKRETFSMVCAESLCCGTPVVGFKAGAPEQIALKEYSFFANYGDVDSICEQIRKFSMNMPFDEICCKAMAAYSADAMVKNYISIYQKLLQGIKEKDA